jgi:hypothetical protein
MFFTTHLAGQLASDAALNLCEIFTHSNNISALAC